MIIKCPECRKQVSTMAGTCPYCNTKIAGQLRTCPNCGSYCLVTQEKCPECESSLSPLPNPSLEENPKQETEPQKAPVKRRPKKRRLKRSVVWGSITVIFLGLLAFGYHYYSMQRQQQKEQDDYERLAETTNPVFYQQFIEEHPDSPYREEIMERMLTLQKETEAWERLLQGINRKRVTKFLEEYPGSLRQRLCEDMLDSIDWHDALASNTEQAITKYLANHPSGRYVTEAADKKNALLLAKVTPEERAMLRGVLETFFSKAIANQDIEAAREAIPDTTMNFCGNQKADAEAIVQYAREKMEKDVIGLHYIIGQQLNIHRETLPDGNTGFSVEVNLQETISRSDMNQPASNIYHINALINQEQKIVRLNIVK